MTPYRISVIFLVFWLASFKVLVAQVSGLPVIRIETQNGASINSKTDWTNMTSFVLTDSNDPSNNVSRVNIQPNLDRIRGRGNMTWTAPKKPYRIRFRENISFFGLAAAENWVLLAEYFDPTHLNNSFAFELGARLNVPYTPTYHHVELYLNGVYQGNYVFTEHRQAAPKGVEPGPGRVGIDLTEGWLAEIDFHWHDVDDDPKFRTRNYNLPMVIKSPDLGIDSNLPGYNIVKNDWNQLCDLMFSGNFPENGYREMIDMESIINFFLVQIVTHNTDFYVGLDGRAEPGSLFFHKDKNGKITAGPLWDFDLSFRYGFIYVSPDSRPYPTYSFLNRFFQDPVFWVKWKEHWHKNLSAVVSMNQFIDDLASKVRKSMEDDYKIWRPAEPITEFDRRIRMMKEYFNERLEYLNLIYNRVDVLPENRSFGTITYNDQFEIPEQKFTLIAYGETDVMAYFRNVDSAFEISTELSQIATEDGGYLSTVSVKPKNDLLTATYSDVFILSGTNQGKEFSLWIPLNVTIKNNTVTGSQELLQPAPLCAWMYNGQLRVTGLIVGEPLEIYNLTGQLIFSSIVTANEIDILLNVQGVYIVKAGDRTVKAVFQ